MKFGHIAVRWSAPEGIVGIRGPFLIVNYRGAVSPAVMRATEEAQRDVLAQNAGTCLMLCVVEGGLPLPDEDGRATILSHFRTVSSRNTAYAAVVLGDGFWASAARSIMSTFTLAVKAKCPAITSNEIDAGVKFLSTHAPNAALLDVRLIASEVGAMRRAADRGNTLIDA